MAKTKKRQITEAIEAYFEESRKPVYSFVMVLPFLFLYELGIIVMLSSDSGYRVINGADDLIRKMLSVVGIHGTFVSVAVVGVAFAIWEWRRKAGWKLEAHFIGWLWAECMLYALFLLVIPGQFLAAAGGGGGAGPEGMGLFELIVLSCGAGVYEELVFRLILVGLLALFLRHVVHLDRVRAGIVAVIVGSLIFSAFHYKGLLGTSFGDPFAPGTAAFWHSFVFRAAAGAFFSVLYYFRSFGVAVGTHALYDVMASIATVAMYAPQSD